VQLAASQKKILGYTEGNMVPYSHSEGSVKEHCAAWQQPFLNPVKKQERLSYPVATWEETRTCLSAILCEEVGIITVSSVKRLFRSRFGLDLSETALGHSRLTELLEDPRLRDICSFEVHNGQFLIKAATRLPFVVARTHAYDLPRLMLDCTSHLPETLHGHAGRAGQLQPPTPHATLPCLSNKPTETLLAPPQNWLPFPPFGVHAPPPGLDAHPWECPPLGLGVPTLGSARPWECPAVEAPAIFPPPGLEAHPWECPARATAPEPLSASEMLSAQLQRLFELDSDARQATLQAFSKSMSLAVCAGSGADCPDEASTEYGSEHLAYTDSDISGLSCQDAMRDIDADVHSNRFGEPAILQVLAMRATEGRPGFLSQKPWHL